MSTTSETMAVRIVQLRHHRRMTLQELADAAGASKSWIWELEHGRASNITIDMAVKLARALGVSLDYLTGLSTQTPDLHPEAMRIACEIDRLLRARSAIEKEQSDV